jgi:hypothetical protein
LAILFWSSPRSRRRWKGGSSAVLTLEETTTVGKLGIKWGKGEKRVGGSVEEQ